MSETVTCPKCGSAVDSGAGFGMVTCSSCGEFILLGENSPSSAEPTPPSGPAPVELSEAPPSNDHGMVGFSMDPMDPMGSGDAAPEVSFEVADSSPAPVAGTGSAQSTDHTETQTHTQVDTKSRGPLSAIADFGNQNQVSSGFSGLVYDLKIGGIDTLEIRKDLADCLSDRRLGIDTVGVMASVEGGVLQLKEISPVKASVILNRLRHLPFKVSWTSRQLVKGALVFFILLFLNSSRGVAGEWAQHEINLKGYATRIRSMQEEIEELIVKKNKNKDPKVRDDMLKDIIKKNEDLQRVYKDFKDEKEHIRFEHPEQGDNTERKYHHVKLKSLEELENEVGIDGQLGRIKHKVQETYNTEPAAGEDSGTTKTKFNKKESPSSTPTDGSPPMITPPPVKY